MRTPAGTICVSTLSMQATQTGTISLSTPVNSIHPGLHYRHPGRQQTRTYRHQLTLLVNTYHPGKQHIHPPRRYGTVASAIFTDQTLPISSDAVNGTPVNVAGGG